MIFPKVWLVVKPSTGIPVMLAAVAVTALVVHLGVLSQTTWFGEYWNGMPLTNGAGVAVGS
ncbi:light-harvesting protein [Rhodobacter sp. Har01]|uniref:light-harvesting protein n=1 Tax=Rhodobacter sp. Har01 TaxID=2883999 RepID=UPI001D0833E3|nr:light-harvesting protein [Rhodobacter sp. Har01]MCB6176681.1 light-harvesting protein [Rhodobacter sp. Har01]